MSRRGGPKARQTSLPVRPHRRCRAFGCPTATRHSRIGVFDVRECRPMKVLIGGIIAMATYMLLSKWTDQGRRDVATLPDRVTEVTKSFEEMGGKVLGFYLTMGQYDQ